MPDRWLDYLPLDELIPADDNPNLHHGSLIDESIEAHGLVAPIEVDERTGKMVAGHGRRDSLLTRRASGDPLPDGVALDDSGAWVVPVLRGWSSRDDAQAEAYMLASNIVPNYDPGGLSETLGRLQGSPLGLYGTGHTDSDLDALLASLTGDGADPVPSPTPEVDRPSLAERFGVPPFSVLDARQGYWQARRRQWLALGIRSEEGRPTNALGFSEAAGLEGWAAPNRNLPDAPMGNDPQFYYKKRAEEALQGRELSSREFVDEFYEGSTTYTGHTSIFDPTLTELIVRWFSPAGGRVIDPFAGGSVRGIVSSVLGRSYEGVELRSEQIASNREQAAAICRDAPPIWIEGDARDVLPLLEYDADLVLSCPPYGDLERYSDDVEHDLSAMAWPDFLVAYRQIIARSVDLLAPDRFACFVVSEIRDPATGLYRGLLGETVDAFAVAGATLYNDAVLLTAIGSLALRAARIFQSRKLARAHQNVLVFVKGDGKAAAAACGELELAPDLWPAASDGSEDDSGA